MFPAGYQPPYRQCDRHSIPGESAASSQHETETELAQNGVSLPSRDLGRGWLPRDCFADPEVAARHTTTISRLASNFRSQAASRNCRVVNIIDQTNCEFDHPRIPTPLGRCQSIASVHAYSQLHARPEIWTTYIDPANRHMGFAMLQRGGQNGERFAAADLSLKLHRIANGVSEPSQVAPQEDPNRPSARTSEISRRLRDCADEFVLQTRLSFVPGASNVFCQELGECLAIDEMIAALAPGIHLLKLSVASGQSHMISCRISDAAGQPSLLMDPNFCEWAGDERDLGLLLKDCWEQENLIEKWCRGGKWQRLTYVR